MSQPNNTPPGEEDHEANEIACEAFNDCIAAIQAKIDPDNITDGGNWAADYFEHRCDEFFEALAVLCKYTEDHKAAVAAVKAQRAEEEKSK